ncbi:MAG: ATP-binding protein [Anaerovoracaceae bacterium]|jgi:DNA replication protein DnaC
MQVKPPNGTEQDANLFFQLIDGRYEKKNTLFTTINFSDRDTIFYDAVIADAILNRSLHIVVFVYYQTEKQTI